VIDFTFISFLMHRHLLLIFYIAFFIQCTSPLQEQKTTVALQPYKGFDAALVDTVALAIQKAYGFSVEVLPERALPKNAFVNIKSPRYRADSLLIDLKENKPNAAKYIIGLTNADISTTKRDKSGNVLSPEHKYLDWGIFGLGYRPGPSCVVSSHRLKHADKAIFISRLKKVSIHELGHNLGLHHCETAKCVMQDAVERIQTVDSVGFIPCESCRRKI
jgi:archaemetzincin